MCTGIALMTYELPAPLVKRHRLDERVHVREGQEEFQFHWWQQPTVLPVRMNGQYVVLPWGCKVRKSPLPYGGWLSIDRLEAGVLGSARLEEVVIPANLALIRGAWLVITEGIRGVAVATKVGPVAYMLVQRSTNYYRNLSEQTPMMPVFVGQVV